MPQSRQACAVAPTISSRALGERRPAPRSASSSSEPLNWTKATVTVRCSPRSGSCSRMCGREAGRRVGLRARGGGVDLVGWAARGQELAGRSPAGARQSAGSAAAVADASRTSPASARPSQRDDLAGERAGDDQVARVAAREEQVRGARGDADRHPQPPHRGRRAGNPQRAERLLHAERRRRAARLVAGPGEHRQHRVAAELEDLAALGADRRAHRDEHGGDRVGQRLGADPAPAREALAERREARDVAEDVGGLELAPGPVGLGVEPDQVGRRQIAGQLRGSLRGHGFMSGHRHRRIIARGDARRHYGVIAALIVNAVLVGAL